MWNYVGFVFDYVGFVRIGCEVLLGVGFWEFGEILIRGLYYAMCSIMDFTEK